MHSLGHVIYDEDTEELLIVKFAKWDKGYANEKRRPVLEDAAREIVSETLRAVLADELSKIAADLPDIPSDATSDSPSDRAIRLTRKCLLDTASDIAPDATTRFDRVVVTKDELVTPTHNPQSATPAPVADATRALAVISSQPTAQSIVAEWIEHCAKRPPGPVIGQTAKAIGAMLAEGVDPDDVRRGVAAWHQKGLHPSTLPSVVNEVMNSRPQRPRQQQETDDMFDRAARRMGVTQ
jgi:hypothetical protein